MFEAEEFDLGGETFDLFIKIIDQLFGQFQGLLLAAEDESIGTRIDGDVQRVYKRLPRCSFGLARAAGAGRQSLALTKNGGKGLRDSRGIRELELNHLNVDAFDDWY